jgi:hypothetical protein
MQKTIPWILSALLAIATIGIHFQNKAIIEGKDAEIKLLNEKNANLISEANSKLSDAAQKLKDADTRAQQIAAEANNKIQALATEATEKLQAANQPEATVAVAFRKALLGNGNVAMIKNTGPQAAPLTLQFIRASTGQQRSIQVVIDQSRSVDIGEREGWAFLPGDEVQVSQPGHKSRSFRFQ